MPLQSSPTIIGETTVSLQLPAQPIPLDGESFTSWLVRLTEENQVNYRAFMRWYLEEGEWRRRDFDLLEGLRRRILGMAGGKTDERVLRRMTLSAWISQVGPKHSADRKSLVSSLGLTRYCPKCRVEDSIKYLRRIWRLHSVPICPRHLSLLQSSCAECGATEPLLKFRQGSVSGRCRHCGRRYDKTTLEIPHESKRLVRFVQDQSRLLETGLLDTRRYGSSLSVGEFYGILRFLIRMGNLQLQYGKLPSEEFRTLPVLRLDWRKEEYLSCLLIERSLKLMEDWSSELTHYIRENQALFNEVAHELGDSLPTPLRPFRKVRQGNFRHRALQRLARSSDEREGVVREAVDILVEEDKWVGPVTIEMLTGVSYKTIMAHENLHSVVIDGQDRLRKKHLLEVQGAIQVFRAKDIRPTIRAVSAYIGHSPKFIRNSPELLEVLRNPEMPGSAARRAAHAIIEK